MPSDRLGCSGRRQTDGVDPMYLPPPLTPLPTADKVRPALSARIASALLLLRPDPRDTSLRVPRPASHRWAGVRNPPRAPRQSGKNHSIESRCYPRRWTTLSRCRVLCRSPFYGDRGVPANVPPHREPPLRLHGFFRQRRRRSSLFRSPCVLGRYSVPAELPPHRRQDGRLPAWW